MPSPTGRGERARVLVWSAILAFLTTLVQRVPERQETAAQGLYFFYTGIFMAICTFASGFVYTWFGVQGFHAMSAVAFFGFGLIVAAWKVHPQKPGSAGMSSEPS